MKPPAASTVHLPSGSWSTALDALCARFVHIERETWLQRMARGVVTDAQGVAITAQTPYREGMCIHYQREVADEVAIPFEARVLHADADLVVVDKPHFLPVMPAGRFVEHTVLRRLMRTLDNSDLVPLHRIDRLTAGLVMFSANPATRDAYQALFRERRVSKRYLACAPPLVDVAWPLVHCSRLAPGEPFFRMREVPGATNSETRIEPLSRAGELWRYALYPLTGRKHQLRVHMAALGAPIANDPWYPVLRAPAADDWRRPLRLLAQQLAFVDPLSGAQRSFASQLLL
ncbi:MAG: pseudouridine synthase [Rhodanobacter sp.]